MGKLGMCWRHFWRYEVLCLGRARKDSRQSVREHYRSGASLVVIAAFIGLVWPLWTLRGDVASSAVHALAALGVLTALAFLYHLFMAPSRIDNERLTRITVLNGKVDGLSAEIVGLKASHETEIERLGRERAAELARLNAELAAARETERKLRASNPVVDCPADTVIERVKNEIPGWSDKTWEQIADALMRGVVGGWFTLKVCHEPGDNPDEIKGGELREYRLDNWTYNYTVVRHKSGLIMFKKYYTKPMFCWPQIELYLGPPDAMEDE